MRHPIFIRPARPDDSSAVEAMLARSYPELLPQDYDAEILNNVLPLITRAKPALMTCGTYFLAECAETEEVIGAGGWTDISPANGVSDDRRGHVRHVATRSDWVRRGVARRLIEVTLASAEAHGMERMSCMSTLTARGFYEALGFEDRGVVELSLAPGVHFPTVQMTRAL